MILFVHIPKTAGTSFRHGMSQILPGKNMLLDYGPDAPETDAALQKLYEQGECSSELVAQIVAQRKVELIGGHFLLTRYLGGFPSSTVVTFVREPLQRCYSEFLHRQRLRGYKKPFFDFIQRQDQINLQSRYLNGMPEKGIVGISEYYAASLEMINKELGVSIPGLKLNCHRNTLNQQYGSDSIPDDAAKQFYEMNKDDVALYNKYLSLLKTSGISLEEKENYLIPTVVFHTRQFFKKIHRKISTNVSTLT